MPPGVHRNKEPALHLSAKPAHESAPPGPPLSASTIHEHFRALSAGRDCLVDTPFGKELEPRWSAQTASAEFTIDAFEESLVLTSSYYLLSAKRRAQERIVAWRALEQAHPHGNPTLPAHGIVCGHETFWLLARNPSSTVRVPLLRSTALLETTPGNTFAARAATLSIRRGETFQQLAENNPPSPTLYEQTCRLLGQLAKRQTVPHEPFAERLSAPVYSLARPAAKSLLSVAA